MPQATETSCTDGFDNDCDGLTDAADSSCAPPPLDGGYAVSQPSPQVFIDACAQPGATRHTWDAGYLQDDGATPILTMPFPFQFYAAPVTQYWVSTNGVIGFGTSPNTTTFGGCLPSAQSPRPGLYLDLDDLITQNGVGLCTATIGAAPNRKVVVTWPSVSHYNYTGVSFTFSAFLSETTNTVDFVYSTMTGTAAARGVDAVIGMQSSTGARFNELACFQSGYLMSGVSIRFTPN
jgi:hypothetical protein